MKIEFNTETKSVILDPDSVPKTEEEVLVCQELSIRLLMSLLKQGDAVISNITNRETQKALEDGMINMLSLYSAEKREFKGCEHSEV